MMINPLRCNTEVTSLQCTRVLTWFTLPVSVSSVCVTASAVYSPRSARMDGYLEGDVIRGSDEDGRACRGVWCS